MLLYFSVAGICKQNVGPTLLVLMSVLSVFSCVNSDPLTIQTTAPAVALQLKVAVDPSMALTDVGVVTKAEKCIKY